MGKDLLTFCTVTILHHYYSDIDEKAECNIVPTNHNIKAINNAKVLCGKSVNVQYILC